MGQIALTQTASYSHWKRRLSIAAPYTQILEFETVLGMQSIQVRTKQGFANWDSVTPAAGLLVDTARVTRDDRILLLGCGHGALAVAMAAQAADGEIWCVDTNFVALRMAAQTIQANGVENAHVHRDATMLPAHKAKFDVVLMELPKGRDLARRWLVEAWHVLRPGGKFYLAGPNALGVKSVTQDLEALFGAVVLPSYKKRNRVAIGTKQDAQNSAPTWTQEAGIAPGTWREFSIKSGTFAADLCTLPGVFAYGDLDAGTQMLLTHLQTPSNAQVLDVGCGCGVIGLYAAHAGANVVDMVDVNLLAVAAAAENIARQNFQPGSIAIRALASDILSAVADRKYDLIVTNPPFHSGKAVDYTVARAIIEQARAALQPGGQLLLVANKFIRYNELMATLFRNVTTLAEDNRYHLLLASK